MSRYSLSVLERPLVGKAEGADEGTMDRDGAMDTEGLAEAPEGLEEGC